ncbi:MAG: hypothetical protein WCA15_09955 [Candidatus Acidiferrales bacterium]
MMISLWRAYWLGFRINSVLLLFSLAALAQEPPQPAAQQPATQPAPSSHQPGQTSANGSVGAGQSGDKAKTEQDQNQQGSEQKSPVSKDRLFYTLPNFLSVENAANIPPMTTGEKFKVIARSSFDPMEFAWYGLVSAVGQAENSESAYGQGWGAYGKRYATNLADGTIEGFMTSAVFPSVLKQDPRYYVLGEGGFWHRTEYALSRLIITRSDSGSAQFNASEVFGSASAAAISTYGYHPENDKTLGNTASVWGTQVAYDGLAYVVKEFWPDIRRKIRQKRSGDQD